MTLKSISTFGWFADTSPSLSAISPFGWFFDGVVIPPVEVCRSWQSVLIPALRILLDDTEAEIYDEVKLEDTLLVAADMISTEVILDNSYEVTYGPPSITPDPTEDTTFLNLLILKAACIIDKQTFRNRIIDGGLYGAVQNVHLRTRSGRQSMMDYIDNSFCVAYENMKNRANSNQINEATLSPFINKYFPHL